MPKNAPPLHVAIAIPVALIIAGALALSVAAVVENLRFIRVADQVFELVSTVRTVAAGQKGFAQNPGEDIWAELERVGQIGPGGVHQNPWHGDLRAATVSGAAMRIETDMPTRDCRRLAHYFIARQPAELGLLAIEAEPGPDYSTWLQVYPADSARRSDAVADAACGNASAARLALVFRVR